MLGLYFKSGETSCEVVNARPLRMDDNPAGLRSGLKLQGAGTFVPGEQVGEQLRDGFRLESFAMN